jgi:hypothetical protein
MKLRWTHHEVVSVQLGLGDELESVIDPLSALPACSANRLDN